MTYYFISILFSNLYPKTASFFRRYIYTPQIRRKLRLGSIHGKEFSVNIRGRGVITPLYLLVATAVLIFNAVVLGASATNHDLIIWCSGRVLAFNLCILIVSGRQNLFSDRLGVTYEFQAFFHRWLGMVVFLVGIVHGVIALVPYQPSGVILSPRSRIAGFTVRSSFPGGGGGYVTNGYGYRPHQHSLLLYCLPSLPCVRRFMKCSATVMSALQLSSL
jgi:hypothetical protein